MKKIFSIILFSILSISTLWAGPLYLEGADQLSFDGYNTDAQVLTGNVRFRHDNSRMFCDRANFYEQRNLMDAFGNVRIVKDSVTIYGDRLHYNGNTKMARMKGRVRVVSKQMTLETDSLDFDQENNIGYYYTGGKIHDQESVLTSVKSEMNFKTNLFTFRENVVLTNPTFILKAPALKYNSQQKTAYFIAPTNILYNNETKIHTEDGWYNTNTEDSKLIKNASVRQPNGQNLKADTILYNKKTGLATAFSHIQMIDSAQQMTVYGNYGTFQKDGKEGFVNKQAYMAEYSSKDTLFLHAEVFRTQPDSTFQKLRALGNVRFYRFDLQGKCDSLIYNTRDSIMNMYSNPVIWTDSTQLMGDFIQLYQKNKRPSLISVTGWALGISQSDSIRFDQLAGKTLKAYIDSSVIYKVEVIGNAKTVYNAREDDGTLIGVNTAESEMLTIHMRNKRINRIVMMPSSNGVLYPEEQLPEDKKYLPRFVWLDNIRPKQMSDIFLKFEPEKKDKKRRK